MYKISAYKFREIARDALKYPVLEYEATPILGMASSVASKLNLAELTTAFFGGNRVKILPRSVSPK